MKDKIFLTCYDGGLSRASWQPAGDWVVERVDAGRPVTCLAADPADPRRVYAGTQSGLLRSTDAGKTWRAGGLQGQIVKSLAVSPHDPQVIYAGTKPALMFHSRDGGETWAELEGFRRIPNRWWWFSPAEPPDRRPYVISIALSPAEPEVLLAGVEVGGVVRSQDGGRSWSRHRPGALRDCHSLKFHATQGNWLYQAGGSGGGASFSRDGGISFQKAKRGLAKNYGIVCAADPVDPETWYVCVAPGPFNAFGERPEIYLYRRAKGTDWQPIGWEPHPLSATPTALVTIPGAPGQLYAGLKSGEVWHTADHGDSWSKLPFRFEGIWFSLVVMALWESP